VKRNVSEVLRRGFELTSRNWPLLLIRVAEHILALIIAVASFIAIVVPVAVSLGLGHISFDKLDSLETVDAGQVANLIVYALMQHWMLVTFIFLVISVVLLLFVAIHSFVQAGSAEVYIANEFSVDRWMAGGKRGWWPVFWIYNLAWLASSIVLLIPIAPIPFFIRMSGESMGAIVAGCALLAIWGFFAALVAIATMLWTTKAIVLSMTRNLPAREALKEARHAIRADFGRNFAVGFIVFVIWIGGSMFLGLFSGVLSAGHTTPLALFTAPAHIVMQFVSALFTAGVESWLLASFISMES
jgi:hypothetical protein